MTEFFKKSPLEATLSRLTDAVWGLIPDEDVRVCMQKRLLEK